jgi:predicted RNase H-like HicB family nuclease
MPSYTFKALIRKERFYVAECPELGVEAQGRSVEEALAGLRIATEEYLQSLGAAPHHQIGARAHAAAARHGGVLMRRYSVEVDHAPQEPDPDPGRDGR